MVAAAAAAAVVAGDGGGDHNDDDVSRHRPRCRRRRRVAAGRRRRVAVGRRLLGVCDGGAGAARSLSLLPSPSSSLSLSAATSYTNAHLRTRRMLVVCWSPRLSPTRSLHAHARRTNRRPSHQKEGTGAQSDLDARVCGDGGRTTASVQKFGPLKWRLKRLQVGAELCARSQLFRTTPRAD